MDGHDSYILHHRLGLDMCMMTNQIFVDNYYSFTVAFGHKYVNEINKMSSGWD